jgi:putative membrane protein
MREAKPLAIVLIVLVGLVLLSATTMGGMMGGSVMGPGMMWGYGSQGGSTVFGGWGPAAAMGLGWLMMLAFWGALVVGAVLLVRWLAGGASLADTREDPLVILQRRYARGEIDEETYRRMRREIVAPTGDAGASDSIRRAS